MSRNGSTVTDPIAREQARQAAALTTMGPAFKVIDMELLVESPLNTRKHFDQAKLADLRQSIAESGILTPMLVRPNARVAPKGKGMVYEIAAGHRRFRAAQLAGVTAAPCVVREMDDATFLEVLTIENLQREDVHPLEEAQGYKQLLAQDGYDIARLAKRVGKSESYVYDRMKLLQLTPAAQKLFFAHRFTLGHAVLLARLSKEDQARCLSIDNPNSYGSAVAGGLWQHEGAAHPPLGLDDPTGLPSDDEDDPVVGRLKPRSVRELQAWIDDHVRFTGPDETTPHLFADTAANLAAAEQTKAKIIDISRDHQLSDDAKHPDGKRTYSVKSWKRADGNPEDKGWGEPEDTAPCDYSVLGVVVAGRGRGESFQVCIDKKRCMTHWADEIKKRNRREKERERESKASANGKAPATQKEPSWQRDDRLRTERNARLAARWDKGGTALLTAIAQKLTKLSITSTGPAGKWFWDRVQDGLHGLDAHAKKATSYGVRRGSTAVDLVRQAIMCHLIAEGEPTKYQFEDNEKDLQKELDALGIKVNVKQLLDAANPEPAAKPKATAKKAAPKKKAKAKARASR